MSSNPSFGTSRSHGAWNRSKRFSPTVSRQVRVSSRVLGGTPEVGRRTPSAVTSTVGTFSICWGSRSCLTTAAPPASRNTVRPAASSAVPGRTVSPGCPGAALTSRPSATPQVCRAAPRASSSLRSWFSRSIKLSERAVSPLRAFAVSKLKYSVRLTMAISAPLGQKVVTALNRQ
ncbi:hypothetical protein [Streptomyces swartbergensis]|uniref:hypothetical protein n=1 Tax=Streptomyces swartbergensis TaxID=487165 RepID=UPI003801E6DA